MTPGTARPGAPTITEVARAARVSRQTVSNTLNRPSRVGAETRAHVLTVIEQLGYQPNRFAQSLRRQETRQIGYRLDPDRSDTASVLQDRFLHSLVIAAESSGYNIVLFASGDTGDELEQYAGLLRTRTVDGFVLSGIDPGDPRPDWLAERQAPFVCFGRPKHDALSRLWVDVDGAAGTDAAVEHLVAKGHRHIAFVGWPSTSGPGEDRLAGWRRAMTRHGLDDRRCARTVDTLEDSARAAAKLLDHDPRPTAIVAASDTFALGCYAAARDAGLRVGSDLDVVGFDDSPIAALVTPALTSVRQPTEEIAKSVVRLLVGALRQETSHASHVLLGPALILRDSA